MQGMATIQANDSIVPYLANGLRLSEHSIRVLTEMYGSLAELCSKVLVPNGAEELVKQLGKQDALRVVEFLTKERSLI